MWTEIKVAWILATDFVKDTYLELIGFITLVLSLAMYIEGNENWLVVLVLSIVFDGLSYIRKTIEKEFGKLRREIKIANYQGGTDE